MKQETVSQVKYLGNKIGFDVDFKDDFFYFSLNGEQVYFAKLKASMGFLVGVKKGLSFKTEKRKDYSGKILTRIKN